MSSSYLFLGTKTFAPPVCLFGFQGLSAELDQISQKNYVKTWPKLEQKWAMVVAQLVKKLLYTQ